MTTFVFAQAVGATDVVAASGPASYAWLLILIPLASAGLLLLLGRASNRWGHLLATAASWATFIVGALIAAQMWSAPESARRFTQTLFTWIPAGDFTVNFGLLVDPLSITFVILVTFVGSLIHVYAIAYMAHDPARRRFFAYLNFFIAAMLTLVLADSYAGLFAGWEGVGLASYLLIGFWNHVPANAIAAKKAFIMNRVGDMGMLIAMMAMVASFHSVTFADVSSKVASVPTASATVIGFFLLVAACGKSAQFPLQAWLGDAMAGPTPVSALIHAATMVTAGVYLIVRSGAVFVAAPVVTYQGYSGWDVAAALKERVLPGDLVINCGDYKVSIPYYSDLNVYQAETAEEIERKRPDGKSWKAKNVMPFIDISQIPTDRRVYLIVQNRFYNRFAQVFNPAEWEKLGEFPNHRLYMREAKEK